MNTGIHLPIDGEYIAIVRYDDIELQWGVAIEDKAGFNIFLPCHDRRKAEALALALYSSCPMIRTAQAEYGNEH